MTSSRASAGAQLSIAQLLPYTTLVVLLLLLASLSPVRSQFAVPYGDVRLLTVIGLTSTTGACINQWPAVLNCTFPAPLVVSIGGFPATGTANFTGSASYSLYVLLVAEDGAALSSTQLILSATANTTSTARGTIRLSTYAPSFFSGELLGARLYDSRTSNPSNVTWDLATLMPYPVPTLLSISGCQGEGLSTLLCVPDESVLVVQGSGLTTLNELSSFYLTIGTYSTYMYSSSATFTLVNDTLTLQLGLLYTYLKVNYSGPPVPLFIRCQPASSSDHAGFTTNALSISFGPLPPPVVRIASGTAGCVVDRTNVTLYSGCLPITSTLTLTGHYLSSCTFALTATGKGTYPATINYATGTQASIYVPIVNSDSPGQPWDLVATNPSGSVTIPSAVQFTIVPTMAEVVDCIRTVIGPYLPNCRPGQTITITGSNFASDAQVLLTDDPSSSPAPVTFRASCPSVQFVDRNTVTCVLPTFDNATIAQLMYAAASVSRCSFHPPARRPTCCPSSSFSAIRIHRSSTASRAARRRQGRCLCRAAGAVTC